MISQTVTGEATLMAGKYHPLTVALCMAAGRGQQEMDLGFDEIAALVGGLPPSAGLRQWWANADHPQAHAWRTAGYRVQQVYLDRRRVRFSRLPAPMATDRRDPRTVHAGTGAGADASGGATGSGSACSGPTPVPWCSTAPARRLFPASSRRGFYRITFTGPAARIYIGESENLHRRLSGNYPQRRPQPADEHADQRPAGRPSCRRRNRRVGGGDVRHGPDRRSRTAPGPVHQGGPAARRERRRRARPGHRSRADREPRMNAPHDPQRLAALIEALDI
ncbi:hypothetical protein GCM10023107_35640 [Actinoplanes octamycinicus]|nr:hypothetical protein Aoc01nite_28850 [Actinoplanes octamycinicus]